MRMKHGSDRGPTISVKPRLLAAFTAVAMMFATAVPAMLPKVAQADDPTDLGPTDSGFYKPGDIHLGDDMDDLKVDTGVATWVGRDMYVGGRPDGSNLILNGNKTGGPDGRGFYTYTNAPTASFAAEAEGLTIVKGKLAINQIKDSWSTSLWNQQGNRTLFSGGQGFRFGIAGFGAQFRPASGSTALVVAGEGSNISSMTTGGQVGNVGAWNHNGWIGVTAKWDGKDTWTPVTGEASYKAQLSGNKTFSQGYVDGYQPYIGTFKGTYKQGNRDSIGGNQGAWAGDGLVTWNAQSPLTSVNGTDRSKYTEKIQSDSNTFKNLDPTGTVTVGTADAGSATYYRYSYDNNGISYSFNWENNGLKSEKLITFTGDGTSNLQVFNINKTVLTNGSQGGIDFKFTNIPKDASIVINVTGGNVQFNTGWRFWWDYIDENGNKETLQIGNGYYLKGEEKIQKAYVQAARSIMWNFADANLVTINGGQYYAGTGGGAGKDDGKKPQDWGYLACGTGQESNFNTGCAGDDPAAAMLGSIMVPNGSFDSHVTTNGRVWVGKDFMMNNPRPAAYFNKIEGVSSSVLDMDQERHNLPWTGSVSAEASMIQWSKSDGTNALGGSSWKLYRTLNDAKAQKDPITTVTDNGTGDWNTTEGIISVTGLVPNKNYYLRENGHVQGHEGNTNIYLIQTVNTGDTLNQTISKVWNENGQEIKGTNEDKGLTSSGAIINPPENLGTGIAWGKYADGDTTHTPLPGSKWSISSDGGTTWSTIEDTTAAVTGIVIKDANGATVNGTYIGDVKPGVALKFTASVTPEGAPNGITWTSSNPAMAVVESDGTVDVRDGDGQTVVTLTAASTSDPSITATVSFTPLAPDVSSIEIYKDGETQPVSNITLNSGDSVKLEAVVHPQVTPTWFADNSHVALTTGSDGKVTVKGVSAGTAVVTATAGNKTAQVTVTVTTAVVSTSTDIYVKWTDKNSANLYYYKDSTNNGWPGEPMTQITCNGDRWYKFNVPMTGDFTVIITGNGNDKDRYTAKINGQNVTDIPIAGTQPSYYIGGWYEPVEAGVPSGCATRRPNVRPKLAGNEEAADDGIASPLSMDEAAAQDAASSSLRDADPAAGRFKLENLPDGTYKLKEHTAPEGFTLNSQVYTITISNGSVNWDPNVVSGGIAWISDKPTQVAWDKVDSDNNTLLAGTGWTIYQGDSNGSFSNEPFAVVQDCTSAPCTAGKYNGAPAGMVFSKQLIGIEWPEDRSFEFTLEGKDDAPMPKNAKISVNKPATGNTAAFDFGAIHYDKPGTYKYTVRETKGDMPGVSYDEHAVEVTVTVTDNGKGQLDAAATVTGGAFVNVYDTTPSGGVPAGMTFIKQLIGITWPEDRGFEFTLEGKDNAPMPAEARVSVGKPVEGNVAVFDFGAIQYTTEGEYKYTVTEVAGDMPGVAYAKNRATVTVTVTDDKQGNLIAKAEVTGGVFANVYAAVENAGAYKYKDEDPEPGKFLVKKLPVGTYRLKETTIPNGYTPTQEYYEFTVTDSEETVRVFPKPIGNNRKKGNVYWGKVSSELENGKHVYLAGSAWSIKFKPHGANDFQDPVEITDCVKSGSTETGTCTAVSGSPDWAKDSNKAAGHVSLTDLPWGTYEMVETKAPDGYYADPDVTYIFTVGPKTPEFQNVQIYVKNADGKPGDPITTPSNPTGGDGKPLPGYPNQVIVNEPGVVLPSTGGEGNTLVALFGVALIAISMLGCGVAMRKRI
ncbi:choice-of-anchor A family protein [Bifidobacterium pseudolongum subsp. globosum]|uniref:Choice-of-anchor A family protein n=1 Tax=Bifidobacterium pseudolongum subsp. globosum TaxID=1690 RepID=A0A4Q5A4K9_9BIFI|nr:FctA domain-containing protein [Bifidobacterium pseudolongum]RYQ12203.1 choice-of-anchor A family protein [Bifidobacterium pseudolongum subsp. globosum]